MAEKGYVVKNYFNNPVENLAADRADEMQS